MVFLAVGIARDGFKVNIIWGLLLAFWLVSTPLWLRGTQKRLYAKARHFHGPMSLDTDDYGMRVTGDGVDSRMAWSHFANFYEGRTFLCDLPEQRYIPSDSQTDDVGRAGCGTEGMF